MQWLQTVSAVVFVTVVADTAAEPAVSAPPAGDYVVEVRMEIPNVDAWSWKSTRRVCLPNAGANLPIPVLSPNNPFGNCSAANIEGSGTGLPTTSCAKGAGPPGLTPSTLFCLTGSPDASPWS